MGVKGIGFEPSVEFCPVEPVGQDHASGAWLPRPRGEEDAVGVLLVQPLPMISQMLVHNGEWLLVTQDHDEHAGSHLGGATTLCGTGRLCGKPQ